MKVLTRSICIICAFILASCNNQTNDSNTPSLPIIVPIDSNNQKINELWSRTVEPYLAEDLWHENYNYDASHVLMLPLYYTFILQADDEKKSQFHQFFQRYAANIDYRDANLQRRLFFYFLTVNYLYWCDCNANPVLLEEITNDAIAIWNEHPNTTWGHERFDSYKESITWKINGGQSGTVSYGKALFDAELLLLALGSRLYSIYEENAHKDLIDISQTAQEMILKLGRFNGQRWVFQPGVWFEYRDYAYAGHERVEAGLSPKLVRGIATDSSHIARMPLWLDAISNSENSTNVQDAARGFALQFEELALKTADDDFTAPRLTNYIDGHNGIYRYSYESLEEYSGYGPYELSGSLFNNWYAFTRSEKMKEEFRLLLDNFPLPPDVVKVYAGPTTNRTKHPLVVFPDYFENGFAELYIRIAIQM